MAGKRRKATITKVGENAEGCRMINTRLSSAQYFASMVLWLVVKAIDQYYHRSPATSLDDECLQRLHRAAQLIRDGWAELRWVSNAGQVAAADFDPKLDANMIQSSKMPRRRKPRAREK